MQSSLKPMLEPPFAILGAAHTNLEGKSPSESLIEELVKQTLFPPGKVRWWFSHLETTAENRWRGAQKAAATHRLRKLQARNTQNLESELYYCVCHQQYVSTQTKWKGGLHVTLATSGITSPVLGWFVTWRFSYVRMFMNPTSQFHHVTVISSILCYKTESPEAECLQVIFAVCT